MNFTRINISRHDITIRCVPRYFSTWFDFRDFRDFRKIHKEENIRNKFRKKVSSIVTHYVMNLSDIDFLVYCKYMLTHYPDLD